MYDSSKKKLSSTLLALVILLTGCSALTNTAPQVANTSSKAKLEIPKSFANESSKRQFIEKAVADGYYEEVNLLLQDESLTDPELVKLRGTVRYNLVDYKGAIEAWSKAATLDPNLAAEMQNNIGNALRDSKDHVNAEAAYRKALTLEPTRWTAAANLAIMLNADQKREEAIRVLEEALPLTGADGLRPLLDSIKNK